MGRGGGGGGGGGRELLTISDRGELTEVSCNGGNGIRGTLAETERTYKEGGGGGGGGVIERDPDDSEVDGLTEVSCNGACVTLTETEGACREVE